jgi:2-hydroxychromene-2-carboxylate isomerase
MAEPIDFYFDFSSSYSYIGQHRLQELADNHNREVRWRPVALGAIFKSLGTGPHSPETPKGSYVWKDVERSAADAGLPYHWPEPFPFNSLSAARIYYYIAETDESKAIEWARAVFDSSFGRGKDCSDPAELKKIAGKLGLDAADLLDACNRDEVKQKLKDATAEAMQKGVFGAPTFFVGGDMYWGADRIDQMNRSLGRK